ncbi:hypothetical protein C8F04DRAFT_1181478 [Mycena alexandri]|uniref:Uncharacterized protein n=1 Tax=Mycena alexandri TaxID=1745969 RepID=A0AAD6SZE3_9AGAR|nr:hypothetical protein C8F04DRAFT_1181478 [Mycena alexandri]
MTARPVRDFEILRGPSYWKDFHERRRARLARAEMQVANGGETFHALSNADRVYTFVPGRTDPIVTISGAPGVKSTTQQPTGVVRAKNAYTPPSGSNTHFAVLTREEQQMWRQLKRGREIALMKAVRRGYLREPGNFVGKTDDEIRAHLKTERGKAQLAAAQKRTDEFWAEKGRRERAGRATRVEDEGYRQIAGADEAARLRGPRESHNSALLLAHARALSSSSTLPKFFHLPFEKSRTDFAGLQVVREGSRRGTS